MSAGMSEINTKIVYLAACIVYILTIVQFLPGSLPRTLQIIYLNKVCVLDYLIQHTNNIIGPVNAAK